MVDIPDRDLSPIPGGCKLHDAIYDLVMTQSVESLETLHRMLKHDYGSGLPPISKAVWDSLANQLR